MEKLNKAREEICEQCESGIYIENCKECLFNVLKQNDVNDTKHIQGFTKNLGNSERV